MPNTHTSPARGPRGPLVFDLRSLSRQAGSARSESRIVPAPDDLRLELVRVPVGAEVQLDVKFEAVSEGVLVTGTTTAPVTGECARCLGPVSQTVTVGFQELYLYADDRPRRVREREQEPELDEDEDEQRYLDGELLDLEPAFRDAVVLALPMSPLCREDCPGLCVDCGVPLAEAGPEHTHEGRTDPRWAGLEKLQSKEG